MKAKVSLWFCLGAALAALAAEEPMAGTWSLAGRTKQRQGWSTNGTPLTAVAVVWTNASVSASGMMWGGAPRMGSAVTDNERIYLSANSIAANNNGNIMALDLTTGALLWGTKLSSIYAMGTPVVTANRVYASENSDAGTAVLACLDKTTGAIIWSNGVDQIVGGALLLSDGKVYCGSKWGLEAGMHCYDAEVGTQMWLYTGANGVAGSESQGVQCWADTGAALNPAGTVLYYRSERLGKIVGVDAITGIGLYSNQYFNTVNSEGCQPVVDNDGNVYSGFDGVAVASDPDIVVKFSPTLSQIWIYTFASDNVWGGRGAFALGPDQKTLYCANAGAAGTGVTALNTANGTKKWDAGCGPTSGGIVVGAPSNIVIGVFSVGGIATAKGLRDNGASVSTLWSVPLVPDTGWMGASSGNPMLLPDGDVVVETAHGMLARIAYSPYVSPTNKLATTLPNWYGGSISAVPQGVGGWYAIGEVVTLTANAAAGFSFGGWGGDGSGMQNPLIVTMNVAKAVSAAFSQKPIAFIDSNVWETFNAPFWSDAPWYGNAPDSATRQFYYTNVAGRSCLAYAAPTCGASAQLHTDFGLFPQLLSNKTTCAYSTYAPDMGQPYSIRCLTKNEHDTDNANAVISVNAAGWQTIAPAIINRNTALSMWWIIYGGFPGDTGMPAGQSPTFYVDAMRVTGGSGPDMLVDDFTVNPTWVASGNWQKRPRAWRYDANSDYSSLTWPDRGWSVNTFDPTFATTSLCMSLTFDAAKHATNYARAWTASGSPCLADLAAARSVEADVMVMQANTPVALWFKSGGEARTTYMVQQPAGWQHLRWAMPTGGGVGWTNVQQVGVMVRTDAGDAPTGQVFLDNIMFLTVPEPGVLALLACALALLRRTR